MPLLTSPHGAQTTPSGAWSVGLWIPTHPRDPQDQLCASSGFLAELSALHHTLILGGTRGCQDAGDIAHKWEGALCGVPQYWGEAGISSTQNPTTAGI